MTLIARLMLMMEDHPGDRELLLLLASGHVPFRDILRCLAWPGPAPAAIRIIVITRNVFPCSSLFVLWFADFMHGELCDHSPRGDTSSTAGDYDDGHSHSAPGAAAAAAGEAEESKLQEP